MLQKLLAFAICQNTYHIRFLPFIHAPLPSINVYMPNESGTDYLQGTITLVGNDGTSAPVQIANYSGDSVYS